MTRTERAWARLRAPGATVAHAGGQLARRLEAGVRDWLRALSPARAGVSRERGESSGAWGLRWFTSHEAALVAALADVIMPSNELGPGAPELALAGRPIVSTLDRMMASTPRRQILYARGLVALDRIARSRYGAEYVALSREGQVAVLQFLHHVQRKWAAPPSAAAKVATRFAILYHTWTGLAAAVELLPTLVGDVLQAFYTDPLSWSWLGYDGPPMPQGYPDLLERRVAGQPPRGLAG